jgi:WD40 repeat protein
MKGMDQVHAVAPGDRWVVSGWRDGTARLHRPSDASPQAQARAGSAAVAAVALNADESLAAAGTRAGDLTLLRVPQGKVVSRKRPHLDAVTGLAFAGDSLLASGSRDRTVKLWRCGKGDPEELLTLPLPRAVRAVAFAPDGVRLAVVCEGERAVRIWHLDRLRDRLSALGLAEPLAGPTPQPVPPAPPPSRSPPAREPPRGPHGLRTELFADVDLRQMVKVRYDAQINWVWGTAAPDPLLPSDLFSVRWTGWLKAPRPGRYTLGLSADDGARLWLDGKLLASIRVEPQPFRVEVELTDRPHELRVESFQVFGAAFTRLFWAQAEGFTERPVPSAALFHDRAAAEKASVPQDGGKPAGQ